MLIEVVRCTRCGEPVLVDEKLWRVGTIALHCGACGNDFMPQESPRTGSIRRAANANVDIAVWGQGPHDPSS